jgi:energy-coupling factor transporter transmembrane protein EcfT
MLAALAIAIGAGVALAPLQTLIGAVALSLLAAVTLAGARLRLVLGIGVLAVVPIVSGLAAYGQLHPHELKLLSDAVLLTGFVPLVQAVSGMRKEVKDLAMLIIVLLLAGELVGAVHSHGGLALSVPAVWQDLRWLGAIGWGLHLGSRLTATQRVRWAYRLLVGWNICQTVVALGQIALGEGAGTRFSLPVVSGAFGHPTLGSIVGTILLCLVLSDALSPTRCLSRRQLICGAALALLVVVISTRLKPLLAVGGLLVFISSVRLVRGRWLSAAIAVAIPVVFFLGLPFASGLTATNAESGNGLVGSIAGHAGPRTSLLSGAEKLADDKFPFGWGLGTFGSNIDQSAEDSAFGDAGLDTTFGFSDAQPAFRYDSLMAHVLGERGWAGLGLWVVAFVAALVLMVMISPEYLFPAGAMAAALTLTPISPSLQDPTLALLIFLPVGLCIAPMSKLRMSPSR